VDEEDSPKINIITSMEGSWAEPGQRDLGLKNPGPITP